MITAHIIAAWIFGLLSIMLTFLIISGMRHLRNLPEGASERISNTVVGILMFMLMDVLCILATVIAITPLKP